MTDLIPTVALVNGIPRALSTDVAEVFGKAHKDVLRVISRISVDLEQNFNERNFAPVEYTDEKGEKRPAYSLTRDAFSLVVMGFTGKAALAWKVKFIEAFNAMEAALKHPTHKKSKEKKAKLIEATRALPCQDLVVERDVYEEGKHMFDRIDKLISEVDSLANFFVFHGRVHGRVLRLSKEKNALYEANNQVINQAICNLKAARCGLVCAMKIKTGFDFLQR